MASSTPGVTDLPCCVEVPASLHSKARYALRMLLLPLGFDPRFVGRTALSAGGVYYGHRPEGLPPGVLPLGYDPAAAAYFEAGRPFPASAVGWMPWDGERWPVLFGGQETGWDLVASAFFWLAGWQEVVGRARDPHGRFPVAASLQQALGTVTRPAVDAYRECLAAQLAAHGHALRRRTWGNASWACCPTHDIDYLKKWRKGLLFRETIQYLLLNRRRVPLGQRLRRFGGFLRQWLRPEDVYWTAFERLQAVTQRRGGTATFFMKAGAHGTHDVAYDLEHDAVKARLAALQADGFEVGLHPSYFAHTHAFYLADERDRLARLLDAPPAAVRQHYLRFDPVQTPRLQAEAGFSVDSTLGFAEGEGFRRSTCLPFQVYDAEADGPLDVWEMPLCLMESALFNRQGYTLDAACGVAEALMATCRRFGGVAVMLWHNILWDELDHPGWGAHFEATLQHAHEHGARIAALSEALAGWLGQPVQAQPAGSDAVRA